MLPDLLAEMELSPLEPLPTGLSPRGSIATPVQCILFDVYGTLLISGSGDVGTAMQTDSGDQRLHQLLLNFGIAIPPGRLLNDLYTAIEERHRQLKAEGVDYPEVRIETIWMRVLGWEDIRVARRFALAFELLANPVYPMPGLARLLERDRPRPPMGIISNAQFYTPLLFEKFFNASLQALGFRRDLTIFSFALECAKPSAYLFNEAINRLDRRGISPARTLFVGNDMRNDILPAKNAGFMTALFAGDRRSLRLRGNDEQCRGLEPDLVITELDQLIDYL